MVRWFSSLTWTTSEMSTLSIRFMEWAVEWVREWPLCAGLSALAVAAVVSKQESSIPPRPSAAFQGDAVKRVSVVSSSLASVGYETQSRTLEVQFKNGGIYRYAGVPEAVHSGLMRAPSKGRYFDAFIKKAGYQARGSLDLTGGSRTRARTSRRTSRCGGRSVPVQTPGLGKPQRMLAPPARRAAASRGHGS
ncbi:KTSC domain-containing protein [Streptomyces sp. NPDC059479]|uniref:KTSC domain-containing protein n=1 Tax=Streptomyces sp. NPDC059479 TaxID=3346848 RepID=UPI0036AFE72B